MENNKHISIEESAYLYFLTDQIVDIYANRKVNQIFLKALRDEEKTRDRYTQSISVLDRTKNNSAYRPFIRPLGMPKILFKGIVLVKKVFRKTVKWYVEPIISQQTEFNNAASESIKSLFSSSLSADQTNVETSAKLRFLKNMQEDHILEFVLGNHLDLAIIEEQLKTMNSEFGIIILWVNEESIEFLKKKSPIYIECKSGLQNRELNIYLSENYSFYDEAENNQLFIKKQRKEV